MLTPNYLNLFETATNTSKPNPTSAPTIAHFTSVSHSKPLNMEVIKPTMTASVRPPQTAFPIRK